MKKCAPFVIPGEGGDAIECSIDFFAPWTYACFALSLVWTPPWKEKKGKKDKLTRTWNNEKR